MKRVCEFQDIENIGPKKVCRESDNPVSRNQYCKSCLNHVVASPFTNFCGGCQDMLIKTGSYCNDYCPDGCPFGEEEDLEVIPQKCYCIYCCAYTEERECVEDFEFTDFSTENIYEYKHLIKVPEYGEFNIYTIKDAFKLKHLVYYLHQWLGFPGFFLPMANPENLICDLIILRFKYQISRKAWNKLMHSINGNMKQTEVRTDECKENGGHKPCDKFKQKAKTRLNSYVIQQKLASGELKYLPAKKEMSSKVSLDDDTISNNAKIDVSQPLPSVPITPDPVVEKKINTEPNLQNFLNKEYSYDYTTNDVKPIPQIVEKTHWFGIFRKISLRRSVEGELMYFLITHSYHIFCFLFLMTLMYTQVSLTRFISKELLRDNFNDKTFIISELKGINIVLTHICKLLLWVFLMLLQTISYNDNVMGFVLISFETMILFHIINVTYKKFLKTWYIKNFCYTFYFVHSGKTFYRRTVRITEYLGEYGDEEQDLRRETDKNFKITHTSKLYRSVESVTKYTHYGYLDKYQIFTPTGCIEERVPETESVFDAELCMQMLNSKNTNMNVSAEAMLERMNQSCSSGPFINYDRSNNLVNDFENASARLAQTIALSMRFENAVTDINHQLFRKLDTMRLFCVQQEYSHFY